MCVHVCMHACMFSVIVFCTFMALYMSAVQPQKRHSAGSSDGEHAGKRPQLVTPPLAEDSSSSGTNSIETSTVCRVPQAMFLEQQ